MKKVILTIILLLSFVMICEATSVLTVNDSAIDSKLEIISNSYFKKNKFVKKIENNKYSDILTKNEFETIIDGNYKTSYLYNMQEFFIKDGGNYKIVSANASNNYNNTATISALRPTIYINSKIKVASGKGSAEDPYLLLDEKVYYVKYIPGAGASGNEITMTYEINKPYDLLKEEDLRFAKIGYRLTGWKDASNNNYLLNSKINNIANEDETITLTAQWTEGMYILSYDLKGGTANGTSCNAFSHKYNQSDYTIACTPTKVGYTFKNWKYNGEVINNYSQIKSIADDIILEAEYAPKIYTIQYNKNGGSGTTSSHTCSFGKNCTLKSSGFTKANYEFLGWGKNTTTKSYNAGQTVVTSLLVNAANSSLTLYAIWRGKSFTLTYNSRGGTSCSSTTIYYNNNYGTLCSPSRSGYDFGGWYTAASGGSKVSSSTIATKNVTIYAHWCKTTCNAYKRCEDCGVASYYCNTNIYDYDSNGTQCCHYLYQTEVCGAIWWPGSQSYALYTYCGDVQRWPYPQKQCIDATPTYNACEYCGCASSSNSCNY